MEEPPREVRETLRAFFLWWGITPAAHATSPTHLFDLPLDFSRPEVRQLHRIVLDGYGDPESLLGLADKAGIDPSSLNLTGSPDSMVRGFLIRASTSGLLAQVVDVILDDPTAGTLGTLLSQLLENGK